MKITKKTKIILYDMESEHYEIGTLKNRNGNQMPVCTIDHFFDSVCKLFEQTYPTIGDNPMYQKIDWSEIETNGKLEVEDEES